jgi:hypothetical protein
MSIVRAGPYDNKRIHRSGCYVDLLNRKARNAVGEIEKLKY